MNSTMPMKRTVPGEKSATQGSFLASLSLGWVDFMTPTMANMTASTACTIHRTMFIRDWRPSVRGEAGGQGDGADSQLQAGRHPRPVKLKSWVSSRC